MSEIRYLYMHRCIGKHRQTGVRVSLDVESCFDLGEEDEDKICLFYKKSVKLKKASYFNRLGPWLLLPKM